MKPLFVLFLLFILLLQTGCGFGGWKGQIKKAENLLSEKKYQEAIDAYTQAIEKSSRHADGYAGRAETYASYAKALSGVSEESAAEEEPVSAKEQYQNAASDYVMAISLDPDWTVLYSKLSEVYISLGEPEKALSILRQGYEHTGESTLLNAEPRASLELARASYYDYLLTGGTDSLETAKNLFSQASARGTVEADYYLGRIFDSQRDYVNAKGAYTYAAENGYDLAWFPLGELYIQGKGVEPDAAAAKTYIEKALKGGRLEAYSGLGDYYRVFGADAESEENESTDSSDEAEEAISADVDFPAEEDTAEEAAEIPDATALAVSCYRKALEGEEKEWLEYAYTSIADTYFQLGDDTKAAGWLRIGADSGLERMMTDLGIRYYYGNAVDQDYKKAMECFQNGAEAGDPEATIWLGIALCEGLAMKRDYAKAMEYFQQAATEGFSRGYLWLGQMYYEGNGTAANANKAFDYYRRSAELGCAEGYRRMGDLYSIGQGTQRDTAKAQECYEAAALLESYDSRQFVG